MSKAAIERTILDALHGGPINVEELQETTGLPWTELLLGVARLSITGRITHPAIGIYGPNVAATA